MNSNTPGLIGPEIDIVLFDHDDTLVETIVAKWAHHKFVARTWYNKELTDDEIRPHWGKPFPVLVGLLYETDDIEEALARNASCHEDYPKVLMIHTIPKLRELHAAGKMLGIITATSRFSFEHDMDLHGMPREIIDYTQTADDTEHHKPDGRVFSPAKKWAMEYGIPPHRILYVGDGLHDMHAALDAGFRFIGVETGLTSAEEFQDHDAESVPSTAELHIA